MRLAAYGAGLVVSFLVSYMLVSLGPSRATAVAVGRGDLLAECAAWPLVATRATLASRATCWLLRCALAPGPIPALSRSGSRKEGGAPEPRRISG